ncbi:MAG: RidA family protein [Anaerolineaceae bacterium]
MSVEDRLKELGLALPETPTPAGNYVPAVRSGNMVYVSGHGPRQADGLHVIGKVGRDLTVDEGYAAARLTMLNCLASLKAEIGDLDRVTRIVKLFGMVNCTEDFERHPEVINGGSDLLTALFGDRGKHARSAVGMQSLPRGIAVEIEFVAEVS